MVFHCNNLFDFFFFSAKINRLTSPVKQRSHSLKLCYFYDIYTHQHSKHRQIQFSANLLLPSCLSLYHVITSKHNFKIFHYIQHVLNILFITVILKRLCITFTTFVCSVAPYPKKVPYEHNIYN